MQKTKLVLGIAAALLAALLAGWIWGASGRSAMAGALQASELRGDLLGRADERVKSLGRTSDAMQIEAALSRIDDAQRMAGKLDQGANARAGEAAKMLADVLDDAAYGLP